MTARRRVAILGAGIGAMHLDGYLALPDLFDPRVICDANLARARALAERAPQARIVQSVDDALARDDIDLVDICLPPHLHAEVAAQALRAGKDVICEKPICGSLAEFDRLAALARTAGRHILPIFQYRYGIGFQKLRGLIQAELTGRPVVAALETHWNRGSAYYDHPWRGRLAYELGGAVLSHAIHMHDLLTTHLGAVRRVFARTATRVNEIETEDCAAISLEMENGALVTHSITLGSADELSRLRIAFEHVTVENDGRAPYDPGAEPWRFSARGDAMEPRLAAALAAFEPGPTGFPGLFADIDAALRSNRGAELLQRAGRQSIELATAIYVSAAGGHDVALPIPDDHPAYQGWAR